MVRGFIAEVGDIEHFDITYTRPCRVEIEGVLFHIPQYLCFIPDIEKYLSSWLIHLRIAYKNCVKVECIICVKYYYKDS